MKHSIVIFILFFLTGFQLFGQQKEALVVKNFDRLNIDFQVKDEQHPDSSKINMIDFSQYESLRFKDKRVEIFDKTTGYTLILFSKKECNENQKNLPAKNFFQVPRSAKKEVQ